MKCWVARDKNKSLWIYDKKPQLDKEIKSFLAKDGGDSWQIDRHWLEEVTYKNSPIKIKIKLKT